MNAVNIFSLITPGAGLTASSTDVSGSGGQDFLKELAAVYSALLSGEAEVSEEKISGFVPPETKMLTETPEEYISSETVLNYIFGNMDREEAVPATKDFLSFFEAAANELSHAIDEKEAALITEINEMDSPTAEKYVKDLEEKLALVEELLKKLRQNKGSENSIDAAEQKIVSSGVSSAFDSGKSNFMPVMPGKDTPSVMAAELAGKQLSAEQETPKNPAPVAVNNEAPADTDTDADLFTRTEKAPEKIVEKTTEKVAPPPVKENNVQPNDSTLSARKLPVEEVRMEQGNSNKDTSGQGSSQQGGNPAKTNNAEKNSFTLNTSEQPDETNFNLKAAQTDAAPEQKTENARNTQAERILRWESVKDVEKLVKMVQQSGNEGHTKLTVRLSPENLGRLEVQLSEINGRLEVKLMASSHESRTILANHADAIRQQLAERGIHIDSMDLAFHDSMEKEGGQYESRKNRFAGEKHTNSQEFTKEDENPSEPVLTERTRGLYA